MARSNKEKYRLGNFKLSGPTNDDWWLSSLKVVVLSSFVSMFNSWGFPSPGTPHLQITRWAKGGVFCLEGLQPALHNPALSPMGCILASSTWETPGMEAVPCAVWMSLLTPPSPSRFPRLELDPSLQQSPFSEHTANSPTILPWRQKLGTCNTVSSKAILLKCFYLLNRLALHTAFHPMKGPKLKEWILAYYFINKFCVRQNLFQVDFDFSCLLYWCLGQNRSRISSFSEFFSIWLLVSVYLLVHKTHCG